MREPVMSSWWQVAAKMSFSTHKNLSYPKYTWAFSNPPLLPQRISAIWISHPAAKFDWNVPTKMRVLVDLTRSHLLMLFLFVSVACCLGIWIFQMGTMIISAVLWVKNPIATLSGFWDGKLWRSPLPDWKMKQMFPVAIVTKESKQLAEQAGGSR